eukprot:1917144-Karenia_brevis.AAC.1
MSKLRETLSIIVLPPHDALPTDPRHKHRSLPSDETYKLITDSPREIVRLASLVQKRGAASRSGVAICVPYNHSAKS